MKNPSNLAAHRYGRIPGFCWIIPPLALLFTSLSMAGCGYMKPLVNPVAEPAGPSVFEVGLDRLADGDFAGAEGAFRDVASRCESGVQGRRALLFLSQMALDPRNPAAHPDSAALMAERFLNLPDNTLGETLEAEALYITALDYGADPLLRVEPGLRADPGLPADSGLRADPGLRADSGPPTDPELPADVVDPGFAPRFGNCDEPFVPPSGARPLPVLETSTSGRLRLLDAERDSLTRQNQQLRSTARRLRISSDSLQARVDTLQAELTRIRQLIQLPDTSFLIAPPDTGRVRPPDPPPLRTGGPGTDRLPFGP